MRRKICLPLIFILVVAYGGLALTLVRATAPSWASTCRAACRWCSRRPATRRASSSTRRSRSSATRVDALGVAEPEITRQGDAIVVQLPGRQEPRPGAGAGGPDRRAAVPAGAAAGSPADQAPRPAGDHAAGDDHRPRPRRPTPTTAPARPPRPRPRRRRRPRRPRRTRAPGAPSPAAAWSRARAPPVRLQEPTTTTTAPPTPDHHGARHRPHGHHEPGAGGPGRRRSRPASRTGRPAGPAWPATTARLYQLGPALATGRIVKTAQRRHPERAVVGPAGDAGRRGRHRQVQRDRRQVLRPGPRPAGVPDAVSWPSCSTRSCSRRPPINEPSYEAEDRSRSRGSFSESEAKDLALVLRYGSLPVELERQSVQTVSASLGDDSLRAGHHRRHRGPRPRRALHAAVLPGAGARRDRRPDRVGRRCCTRSSASWARPRAWRSRWPA